MSNYYYEHHTHRNPNFPFYLHDTLLPKGRTQVLHWHEAIEILYFEKGVGSVLCDSTELLGYPGDLIVVNSHTAHRIESATDKCAYKCVILDPSFTSTLGINIDNTAIQTRIHDLQANAIIEEIYREREQEQLLHEARISALAADLIIYLCRNYSIDVTEIDRNGESNRVNIAKEAVMFIREHYREPITVDCVSEAVGFSKYYLSRIFKEVSGSTIVEYIISLRCEHARKLIRSGKYNVSESAERSGYNNLSYFTRSYKNIYGILPSEEKNEPELLI